MEQQTTNKEPLSFIRWRFHPTNSKPIIEVLVHDKPNLFSEILFDMIPMLEETKPDLHSSRVGYKAGQWTAYQMASAHSNVLPRLQEIVDELNEKYKDKL